MYLTHPHKHLMLLNLGHSCTFYSFYYTFSFTLSKHTSLPFKIFITLYPLILVLSSSSFIRSYFHLLHSSFTSLFLYLSCDFCCAFHKLLDNFPLSYPFSIFFLYFCICSLLFHSFFLSFLNKLSYFCSTFLIYLLCLLTTDQLIFALFLCFYFLYLRITFPLLPPAAY